jgi:hypothetical protein
MTGFRDVDEISKNERNRAFRYSDVISIECVPLLIKEHLA